MPFEKGKSGNPGGRPKGKPFRDAVMMEIASAGDDHKALRKIAAALLAKAAGGDVAAINALADRTDGKVAQALIGDSEQEPVRVHTIVRKIVDHPTPCVGSAIAGGAASGISLAAKNLGGVNTGPPKKRRPVNLWN